MDVFFFLFFIFLDLDNVVVFLFWLIREGGGVDWFLFCDDVYWVFLLVFGDGGLVFL